jgi:hypothetical protein
MRKIHSFTVEGIKIVLRKWIILMAAHDGLFSHLKPNTNLCTNEGYLFPY